MHNRTCSVACWSEPFRTMLQGDLGVSFSTYLDRIEHNFDPSANWVFRTWNFQAFEFGLDYRNPSREYLDEKLAELDSVFDLVMLKEYFFESLVLLADELCVDYRLMYGSFRTTTSGTYVTTQG